MQKVKEASKAAKKVLEGEVDQSEISNILKSLKEATDVGAESVDELMSEDVAPHVSNSAQLLEKMFGYQEVIANAITILEENHGK